MTADAEARFRAFQRRWRTGREFEDVKTLTLCFSVIRRLRRAERPKVTPLGNLRDVLERVQ